MIFLFNFDVHNGVEKKKEKKFARADLITMFVAVSCTTKYTMQENQSQILILFPIILAGMSYITAGVHFCGPVANCF